MGGFKENNEVKECEKEVKSDEERRDEKGRKAQIKG